MSRVISTSVLVSADLVHEVLCFMQEPFNDGVRQSPNFPGIFSGIQFCIFGDRKGTEKFSQDTQFCIGSYRFCWTTMTNSLITKWQKSDVNAITYLAVYSIYHSSWKAVGLIRSTSLNAIRMGASRNTPNQIHATSLKNQFHSAKCCTYKILYSEGVPSQCSF